MKSYSVYFIASAFVLCVLTISTPVFQVSRAETINTDQDKIIEKANEILADRHCPCQCGNYLPGNPTLPACFGCSVGKTEITYVLESLEAGKEAKDIIMDLSSPVIVDVFSDYTNEYLPGIWQLAKKVSKELHQKRVVLRAPGLTLEAQRAISFAECARLGENFSMVRESLINHQGPWDLNTLFRLTEQFGLVSEQTRTCVDRIDIDEQIAKDQQHARERGINVFPTTTVNRLKVPSTEQAIRKAIEKVLHESGV